MKTKNEIIEIVYNSIDELNRENELFLEKKIDTCLFGRNSDLDSLGLVNLITLIEDKIEEATGKYIPIADERAMSLEYSPFKSVETLVEYIYLVLNDCEK